MCLNRFFLSESFPTASISCRARACWGVVSIASSSANPFRQEHRTRRPQGRKESQSLLPQRILSDVGVEFELTLTLKSQSLLPQRILSDEAKKAALKETAESQSLLPQRILSNVGTRHRGAGRARGSQSLLPQRILSNANPLFQVDPRERVSIASSSANPFQPGNRTATPSTRSSLNRFFLSESFPTGLSG